MLPISFDHTVIKVSDWQISNSFYREVIGAEVIAKGAGFVYRLGNAQINLHGPGLNPSPLAKIPVDAGNSDICFEWHGPIEAALAHLEKHHVAVEVGPVVRSGFKDQGTSVYFRDPDGSLLEFISYS